MQGIGSMHRSYKKLVDTNTVSVVCVRAYTRSNRQNEQNCKIMILKIYKKIKSPNLVIFCPRRKLLNTVTNFE